MIRTEWEADESYFRLPPVVPTRRDDLQHALLGAVEDGRVARAEIALRWRQVARVKADPRMGRSVRRALLVMIAIQRQRRAAADRAAQQARHALLEHCRGEVRAATDDDSAYRAMESVLRLLSEQHWHKGAF